MNCKPNALAIVVGYGPPDDAAMLGQIFHVVKARPHRFMPHLMVWEYSGPARQHVSKKFRITAVPDKYLKPIRGIEEQKKEKACPLST